jgi:hypothetical protein
MQLTPPSTYRAGALDLAPAFFSLYESTQKTNPSTPAELG